MERKINVAKFEHLLPLQIAPGRFRVQVLRYSPPPEALKNPITLASIMKGHQIDPAVG